jgi:hypothetical protein
MRHRVLGYEYRNQNVSLFTKPLGVVVVTTNCQQQYDTCNRLMSQRRIAAYILTGFGLLLCIVHVGVIISFHQYDPPVRRKFIAPYIETSSKQVRVVSNETHAPHHYYNNVRREEDKVSFTAHDNLEPIPRPKLSSLVQGWNITGDVSWLIQFSIIGFPKAGTSTLMFHLRDHPEIHMFSHERCELAYNRQTLLIEDMYRQFPPAIDMTNRFVRGIKCPMELESRQLALQNYQQYFPKTDFIVGIRHPILWYVICLV